MYRNFGTNQTNAKSSLLIFKKKNPNAFKFLGRGDFTFICLYMHAYCSVHSLYVTVVEGNGDLQRWAKLLWKGLKY